MKQLSSRERLLRVFRQEDTDRMPVRMWGVDPMFPSGKKSWEPLYELTKRYGVDIIRGWSPAGMQPANGEATGRSNQIEITTETRDSSQADMFEDVRTVKTPAGNLVEISYRPKNGQPGYTRKHLIESVADAKKWLTLPLPDELPEVESYQELKRKTGDRAAIMVTLSEAMYSIQAMMGSETFGFWLIEERELLHEMIDKCYTDVERVAKHYLRHGIGDIYGWVGPELCIPPLASPSDFREFVSAYDSRIIAMVHDAGKLAWIHSHGDMNPVLEDFIAMGLDCLNPIEPPPVGKLTLAEAKRRCAGRMTLDGGIENGDFDMLEPDDFREKVAQAVEMGKPDGCFILCPTSDPYTWPELDERILANYRVFVETGMQMGRY